MIDREIFIQQLDDIINDYNNFIKTCQYIDLSDKESSDEMGSLITRCISGVSRIVGNNSEYYKSIQIAYDKNLSSHYYNNGIKLKHIIGVVKALRKDLEMGYIQSLYEIIHGNVFSDYIEMSSHLLEEGYKDPAAVLTGSTLENHLRNLCIKHSIEIEKQSEKGKIIYLKSDFLNSELAKNEAYTKLYQKQISAWLDLRNNAAHGKYEQYNEFQVQSMIEGVRNFILQYPA